MRIDRSIFAVIAAAALWVATERYSSNSKSAVYRHDFDGDGKDETALAFPSDTRGEYNVYVNEERSDHSLYRRLGDVSVPAGSISFSPRDVDNDGNLELVIGGTNLAVDLEAGKYFLRELQ